MRKCAKCHRGRAVALRWEGAPGQYDLVPKEGSHGVYVCNGCAREIEERRVAELDEKPAESTRPS